MTKNKIQYRARVDKKGYEIVRYGAEVLNGRCAQLVRYGRPITRFVASSAQVKALRKGKSINITTHMIERAGLTCTTTLQGRRTALGRAKRRRKR